jgi:hypothetical protein
MPYGGNDWLALTREPTLEPEIPICDPHHHFWDFRSERIPYQRYLLHELAADVNCGHNVRSTVFIEARSTPGAPPWRLDRDRRRTRALSARRSSRHQRNALTGEPDSEPQLGARGGPFPLVPGSPRVSGSTWLSQIDRCATMPPVRHVRARRSVQIPIDQRYPPGCHGLVTSAMSVLFTAFGVSHRFSKRAG